jgi:D-3-phosphoglycerate dehydrogenase
MSLPTIIFDFDSTIVAVETLDILAEHALGGHPNKLEIAEQIIEITNRAMTGELSFGEALTKRLSLLPLTREIIKKTAFELCKKITPSFLKEFSFIKANADRIYIISGGFTECIIPTAERLGINTSHVFANTFLYEESGAIVIDETNFLSQNQGKIKQVVALNLPRPIHIIGDGYTDFELFKENVADEFYCFTEIISRNKVLELSNKKISSLSEYIQASIHE